MIQDNIQRITAEISQICNRSKRDSREIIIVAVGKGRDVSQIREVVQAGISEIGENRVQEAATKNSQLFPAIKWHMVGHLQTNKVKDAVRIFSLIQSVDSLRLAAEINKQAAAINKIQEILLEIKTSPESTKYGFAPRDAIEAVKQISGLKNINIKGLMTIAPVTDTPENTRPYFKMLRKISEEINAQRITQSPLRILSMGMTADYKIAIEEGSNMVRLGRAIFGR